MRIFDHIGNTLKALQVHLFGKGIMTLAVAAAYFIGGAASAAWVLPVVAIGGVVLTVVDRLFRERQYQNDMVNLYRDDIAQQFGIAPDEVTRAHLKEAAKSNDVIDQALTRQRNKTFIAVGTAVLSSASTVFLFNMFGGTSQLKDFAHQLFDSTAFASVANFVGIGTLAGFSGLIFNGGLKTAIDITSGVSKAAANDRIMEMDFDVQHGRAVSKEQVFGVLVAGNPQLQATIAHESHEPYARMNPREKANVLAKIGVADDMQAIADLINSGEIRPGKLAYMLQNAADLTGTASPRTEPAMAADIPVRSDHVERLGLAPKAQGSYRDRIDAERAQPSAAQGIV